jgi:hypothetical protein
MCHFDIPFTMTPEQLFEKLKSSIQNASGNIDGDDTGGSFRVLILGGNISGNYVIAGQVLTVTITHKPFLISCNQIRDFIIGHL